jgi:hypothetical protein
MFLHVFFLFPETASKPLEEVEDIFDDTTPGSIRYIGTPAWKTHVDRNARRLERGEIGSEEEKFGFGHGTARHVEGGHHVGSGNVSGDANGNANGAARATATETETEAEAERDAEREKNTGTSTL